MSIPALTAITHRWEGAVAGHLGRSAYVHVARRCADLAELLGCATAGVGQIAAVSVDLRGVDRSAIARLNEQGVRVLGVYPPGDDAGERTLRRWGLVAVISADAPEDQVHDAVAALVGEGATLGTGALGEASIEIAEGQQSDLDAELEAFLDDSAGVQAPPSLPQKDDVAATADGQEPPGQILAVWGPIGSPGRTTVAVNVAAELAQVESTLLIDADTYGASAGQMLAILDEAPGVAAAARAADAGTLDHDALCRLAPEVEAGLRVLTGLPRADRWPELREHAMADVLDEARAVARWTVVDIGFCLEQDEEITFDTSAPRRNAVSLRVLATADQVILVGTCDPIGLQRLVRGFNELREHCSAPVVVVVTRVRASAVGRDPRGQVNEVLARFAGIEGIHIVPEDQNAMDAALLAGQTLRELRPTSPARVAMIDIAETVSGQLIGRVRTSRRPRWGKK